MKRMLKLIFVITAVLAMTLAAAACDRGPSRETEYGQIKEGVLTVALDTYYPFCMVNENGQWEGIDVEICTQLGEKLGLTVEYVSIPFDQAFQAVADDDADIIVSNVSITEDRRELVDFSDPYASSGISLLAKEALGLDKDAFREKAADGRLLIGVYTGSVAADTARAQYGEKVVIKEYANDGMLFRALISGEIDAIITDTHSATHYDADPDFVMLETYADTVQDIAIAVSKESPALTEAINGALKDIDVAAIFQKYTPSAL